MRVLLAIVSAVTAVAVLVVFAGLAALLLVSMAMQVVAPHGL